MILVIYYGSKWPNFEPKIKPSGQTAFTPPVKIDRVDLKL